MANILFRWTAHRISRTFLISLFTVALMLFPLSGTTSLLASPLRPASRQPSLGVQNQRTKRRIAHLPTRQRALQLRKNRHASSAFSPLGSGNLAWNGGPVEQTPVLYLIFWGSSWNNGSGGLTADAQIVSSYANDVSGTAFEQVLSQYSGTGGAISSTAQVGGIWQDNANPVTDASCGAPTVEDSGIQNEISAAITTNSWPAPTANTIYFVYAPSGVEVNDGTGSCSEQSFCAYHTWSSSLNTAYAAMPYPTDLSSCGVPTAPNGNTAGDALANATSYAQFDAITDPQPGSGWVDSISDEISDKCAYDFSAGTTTLANGGTFELQTEYSNGNSACVTTTQSHIAVAPTSFNLTRIPGSPVSGQTLTVGNSGLATLAWTVSSSVPSWLTLSATSGSLAPGATQNISLTFGINDSTTQSYTTTLILTDTSGASSSVAVPVSVTDPPTITSFTPTLASAGETVTISGTTFDTTQTNDQVTLNGAALTLTGATATSLTVTLPTGVTSGHLAVTTLGGSFTSSSFLFVPTPGYSDSQVEQTGVGAITTTSTLSLTSVSDTSEVAFDASQNQLLGLIYHVGGFESCAVSYQLIAPNGQIIANVGQCNTRSGTFTLPQSGTYTLAMQGASYANYTCSTTSPCTIPVDLVAVAPNFAAAIAVGGPTITTNFPTCFQQGSLYFNGVPGEAVDVNWPLILHFLADVALFNPDGTTLHGSTLTSFTATLRQTGVYRLSVVLDATDGTNTGSIPFTLTNPNALDSGGPASRPFVGDAQFSGGQTLSTNATITTTGVLNPAPQVVYQSSRYGAFTYTLGHLSPGATYIVRLHFAELVKTARGQRQFNVSINGVRVLTNFDIVATAGGADRAVVEQFTVRADHQGAITIAFTAGRVGVASVNGIEIPPPQVRPPVILSPPWPLSFLNTFGPPREQRGGAHPGALGL